MQDMSWRWRSSKKSCLLQHSANTSFALQDAVSSLTDPSSFSPDLATPRGDDHYPTL